MPIHYVHGDPLLTQAQYLAFGHNAKGRTEVGKFETRLMTTYPAAFSSYHKQCRQNRIATGTFWIWRESTPRLTFLVIRASSVGATRLRYIQSIAMTIARDYRREAMTSIAIAPLGQPGEWPEIKLILETWFTKSKLNVIVYDTYEPDMQVDEREFLA